MATFSVTNTFVAGTTAVASQVNTNFSDLITSLTNIDAGTSTWGHVKVSGSDSNLVDFTSSSSSGTEVSINNTATDGDPLLTLKLSGVTKYTIGVDDSDSDTFKIGTTSITTNVGLTMTSAGIYGYLAPGTELLPSLSFQGDANTGIYSPFADQINLTCGGNDAVTISIDALQIFDSAGNLRASISDTGTALPSTTTNDTPSLEFIGEFTSSVVLRSAALSSVANTSKTITSISISSGGDWEIRGSIGWTTAATTTKFLGGINTTTNTLATGDNIANFTNGKGTVQTLGVSVTSSNDFTVELPVSRYSAVAGTTVYLVAQSDQANSIYGRLEARRVR